MKRAVEGSQIARQFLSRARRIINDDEMRSLMDDVTRELGFRYFALIHHVDLRRSSPQIIHIENYPPVWADYFIRNQVYIEDPVLNASLTTNVGFAWEAVPTMISMSRRQREILERGRREGLGWGFTVPANIPGDVHGSCSFATGTAQVLPQRVLLAAQLIGAFAFQAARRIRCSGLKSASPPKLTPRQRECLVLVAKGKTDWEIGRILGLSEETVTKYLNAARARYNVMTRAQLVTAALFDGQIGFMEIRELQ